MVSERRNDRLFMHDETEFHIAIECIICEIGAAYKSCIVNYRALNVELSGVGNLGAAWRAARWK